MNGYRRPRPIGAGALETLTNKIPYIDGKEAWERHLLYVFDIP